MILSPSIGQIRAASSARANMKRQTPQQSRKNVRADPATLSREQFPDDWGFFPGKLLPRTKAADTTVSVDMQG